ncbi:MAG: hypothetical protein HY722_03860 [Planctomycetes bacterium]|nr:hypothetical protein [Planctomycetota bacterium]
MAEGAVLAGCLCPGMPQLLLCPEANPGWGALRAACGRLRDEIRASGADLLVLYSTQWPSVIGHQVQADPAPEWVHVDQEFHELGSMPYRLRMDADWARACVEAAHERGLHARTVAYRGFPVDTGTIVALSLLDPEGRIPASVLSCNIYADRAETLVLGKAARDAVRRTGRRAVAVAVSCLSARLHTRPVPPAQDRIASLKDDEWNRKLLELLAQGRLEDVSQLAREYGTQAHADQKLKAIWWLAAVLGQNNRYRGMVHDYRPVWGTGCAVVGLVPTDRPAAGHEFDEEDVERYSGDRQVLDAGAGLGPAAPPERQPRGDGAVVAADAPRPVGAYPHARRVGDLLYLSGMGPRQAGTDAIPGGPVRDTQGRPLAYDVEAQTRAAIANVRTILEASGSSLERVLDVTVFLIDMDRDFAAFNRVYGEHFGAIGPARTTVAVTALPTPIAVELKVIAAA